MTICVNEPLALDDCLYARGNPVDHHGIHQLPPDTDFLQLPKLGAIVAYTAPPTDVLTLNKYLYADADPINMDDPTGHDAAVINEGVYGVIAVDIYPSTNGTKSPIGYLRVEFYPYPEDVWAYTTGQQGVFQYEFVPGAGASSLGGTSNVTIIHGTRTQDVILTQWLVSRAQGYVAKWLNNIIAGKTIKTRQLTDVIPRPGLGWDTYQALDVNCNSFVLSALQIYDPTHAIWYAFLNTSPRTAGSVQQQDYTNTDLGGVGLGDWAAWILPY